MISTLLHEYAAYDRWANTRFVERLSSEQDSVLDALVPSSFPSLRKTLLHIRDAENAWMCRIQGVAVPWPASDSMDPADLVRVSDLLLELTLGLDEDGMMGQREYHTLKGDPQRSSVWRMMHHCFNHSTQHRGQLITMMRALGLEKIPANDLVLFQRSLAL